METEKLLTPCGEIVGEATAYGNIYRGIRYADAKRFEMPEEIAKWDGVYSALSFGAGCPQRRTFTDESQWSHYHAEFRKGSSFTYSEDCLFLNIYAPKQAKDCPVLVYIHGGSFNSGASDEKQFDGTAYMKKGVVYVSINYRVAIYGFFAGGDSKGNYGVYDALCAINWIRRNIAAFGGDPDNITLMGQSAGAMLTQTLISSGLVEGKVKRAVMLSGGGVRRLMLPLKKPNRAFWDKVVKASGASNIEEFKNMPSEKLFDAWFSLKGIQWLFATAPIIDGDGVKDGKYDRHMIPCIIGTVHKDLYPPVLKKMMFSYAKILKRAGVPCYVYSFERALPGEAPNFFHSADLWYMLGSLKLSHRPFGDEDFKLADELVTRIVAFMQDGTPNANGYSNWDAYNTHKDVKIFK